MEKHVAQISKGNTERETKVIRKLFLIGMVDVKIEIQLFVAGHFC